MERSDAVSAPDCPSHDAIVAYVLGQLSLDQVELVGNHIAVCARCEASLKAVPEMEDTFVANLRHVLEGAPPLEIEAPFTASSTGPSVGAHAAITQIDLRDPRVEGRQLPAQFGPYLLLEKLGEGGMAVVFKARQVRPNRLVAIKIPRCAPVPGTEAYQRFHFESEAVARLQHDNIVRIYECGEQEGLPYFSMEYIQGGSLAQKMALAPLPERQAAELVETLARAVHFAHLQGVVHRDLKPGNVLLDHGGSIKLSDFGLAKFQDTDLNLTHAGQRLGTPAYMAPEQVDSNNRQLSSKIDIWALGVILYELLTGRTPFPGEDRDQIFHKILKEEPISPRTANRRCGRSPETIVLKCLEKNPARRYSAVDLADDLGRWRRGEPILARPLPFVYRLGRALRRHPVRTAAALLGAAALALVIIVLARTTPVADMEGKLAREEPVTLVGETGMPEYFRWVTGQDSAQASLAQDGSFSVHSMKLALVELLPRVPLSRYRIRAELRHEQSNDGGEVGIYFSYLLFPTSRGPVHAFCHFAFNDCFDLGDRAKRFLDVPIVALPPGNTAILRARFYGDPGFSKMDRTFGDISSSRFQVMRTWRSFTIEASPGHVKATWEGQALERALEIESIYRTVEQSVKKNSLPAEFSTFNGVALGFKSQDSLGIYVKRGSASFRHVVVEPLGQEG
jgi:serine/threonine-protein kinase